MAHSARPETLAHDIRDRVAVHRTDAVVLLQKTAETAQLHPAVGLAEAVSHLARAHALLTGELELLGELTAGISKEKH